MGKDLTADQKALVNMAIVRGMAEGVVKCCNCDKEERGKMQTPRLVKVHVSKDYMKFNAAHFIAYKGFREKLHGHNYQLAVTITGQVGSDGYVVDFGEIKKISRIICKDLNESFLVPMHSDALKISVDDENIHILTEDMAQFSFPKADCSLLPIVHSSAEELAIYISSRIVHAFTLDALRKRGVQKLEVSISEANQQFAMYEHTIRA